MQFKIGQTVARQDPGGRETTWSIDTPGALANHTYLQDVKGYKYTDITKVAEVDFDLPEVTGPKITLHRASTDADLCIACQ